VNFLYRIKSALLTFFGDIKVYPFPMFIVYCPDSFRVKGQETRKAMETVQPGDLILRKYIHYLDGYFIPGKYSHTGIYVGDGKVVHVVAEGVTEIDIIDFLRCDSFAILRPKRDVELAMYLLKQFFGKPYDFSFKAGNGKFYCHELAAVSYPNLQIRKIKVPFAGEKILADSFLRSPDFTTVLEYKPKGINKMKKIILPLLFSAVFAAIFLFAGCSSMNAATASFHNTAISFAKTTAKAKAKNRINELVEEGKITPE